MSYDVLREVVNVTVAEWADGANRYGMKFPVKYKNRPASPELQDLLDTVGAINASNATTEPKRAVWARVTCVNGAAERIELGENGATRFYANGIIDLFVTKGSGERLINALHRDLFDMFRTVATINSVRLNNIVFTEDLYFANEQEEEKTNWFRTQYILPMHVSVDPRLGQPGIGGVRDAIRNTQYRYGEA